MTHDCAYVHTGEVDGRIRRPAMVWLEYCGPMVKGECIYHKDGNKDNDGISNLIAVTRGELMQLNNPKGDMATKKKILLHAEQRKGARRGNHI